MPDEILVVAEEESPALVALLNSRAEAVRVCDAVARHTQLGRNVVTVFIDVAMSSRVCEALDELFAAQPTLEVIVCAETPESWRRYVERSPYRAQISFLRKPFETLEVAQVVRRYRSSNEQALSIAHKFAVLGRLAAGIAHDLASPAQYAIMSLEAAREELRELGDALTELDYEAAKSRLASVDRLRQDATDGLARVCALVKAVRSYSHTSRARSSEVLDVNAHVRMVAALVGAQYRQSVRITTDLQDVPPVPGDPDALCRALLNLALNAAQAVDDAKRQQGLVTLRSYVTDGRVVVEVQDNGSGISEAVRDHIFDPFFTTKSRDVGTGQGLTIARELIEDEHEGQLTFDSQPGVGTTFRISLRLTARERSAPRSLSARL